MIRLALALAIRHLRTSLEILAFAFRLGYIGGLKHGTVVANKQVVSAERVIAKQEGAIEGKKVPSISVHGNRKLEPLVTREKNAGAKATELLTNEVKIEDTAK